MRIVSLVPSLSELICDLGLQTQLVGCTKFCVHPNSLRKSAQVIGGTKNVKVGAVLALKPTLVIASKEENVKEQVEEIALSCEVIVTDIVDLKSASSTILALAERLDKTTEAKTILNKIELKLDSLVKPNRVTALYFIWRDPFMSAGGDTYIHSVLTRLGYDNLLADQFRYPSLTLEEIQKLNPQHILLSSEPYPFADQHIAEFREACPGAEVSLVDGELYSWYGSRISHL